MALNKTTAPDSEGIKVGMRQAPAGIPTGTVISVGLLEDLAAITDKSRNVKKYTPLNNTEYEEMVSVGISTNAPLSMDVLYDPEGAEGVNEIELAYETRDAIELNIELNNKIATDGTGKGTTYVQLAKVSSFKIAPEKDGKLKASFTVEFIGDATVTAAV